MRLDLPAYPWFVSRPEGRFVTNIYSGSTGTDKDTGCMNTRTFHYRVYVDITSGNPSEFRLIAESFIQQPWHLGSGKTDFARMDFPASDNGLEQAAEWLAQTGAKYGL